MCKCDVAKTEGLFNMWAGGVKAWALTADLGKQECWRGGGSSQSIHRGHASAATYVIV